MPRGDVVDVERIDDAAPGGPRPRRGRARSAPRRPPPTGVPMRMASSGGRPYPSVSGHVGEGTGPPVEPGQDGVGDGAGEDDAVRVRRVPAGRGPTPSGPTITSGHAPGQRGPHPAEGPHQPVHVLARLERAHGEEELPGDARRVASSVGGGRRVGRRPGGRCRPARRVMPAGRHTAPPGGRPPPAGTGRRARRPERRARRRAASCQRRPRRVVASGWRRQATSWTVTTSALRRRTAQRGRGQRHRVHDVESLGRVRAARGPRPGSAAGPGRRDVMTGRPKRGQRVGSVRRPGARLARSVTSTASPVRARTAASPASRPRAYAPMPPGTPPAQLLDGDEHRGAVGSATAPPPRRGRAPRARRHSAPTSNAPDPGRRRRRSGGRAAPRRPGSGRARSTSASWSPGVDQQRAVAEHLGQRAGPGGHDGHAGPHGLERREPESLVARGVGQHVRAAPAAPPGRAASTQPVRTIRSRARRRADGRRRSACLTPSRRAGQDQRDVGVRAPPPSAKARTRPGRSLRGSAVPMARQ